MALSKSAAAYVPDPGSLAGRVIELIRRNPGEEYTSRDIRDKFGVVTNSVQALLATPVMHGLLRFDKPDHTDPVKVWRAGIRLAEWLALRQSQQSAPPVADSAATPAPSAPATAAAPSSVTRARTPLPELDKIKIRHGVPIPPATRGDLGKRTSVYAAIWQQMKPGSCVELPDRQAKSLVSYVKKHKHSCVVRKLDDGMRGVWRQA